MPLSYVTTFICAYSMEFPSYSLETIYNLLYTLSLDESKFILSGRKKKR